MTPRPPRHTAARAARTPRAGRILRLVGTALLMSAFAFLVIGGATAAAATRDTPVTQAPTSAAERTVAALVGPRPSDALAELPADFTDRFGYRPQVVDGYPTDPEGDCSSPIPMPERFESLCRAHDFGYDLLRYADQTGQPAAPWARRSLDAMLVRAMHASCSNPLCDLAAVAADAGLGLNSWRQSWRAPVVESSGDMASSTILHILGAVGRR